MNRERFLSALGIFLTIGGVIVAVVLASGKSASLAADSFTARAVYAEAHTGELKALAESLTASAEPLRASTGPLFGLTVLIAALGAATIIARLAWATGRALELRAEAFYAHEIANSFGVIGAVGYLAESNTIIGRRLCRAGLLARPGNGPQPMVVDEPSLSLPIITASRNAARSAPERIRKAAKVSTGRNRPSSTCKG